MRLIIIFGLFLVSQFTVWGQFSDERIEVKSRYLGEFGFFYNDRPLNIRQLKQVMALNPKAVEELETALNYRKAAGISSISGALFMGYYLFEVSQYRPDNIWPVIVGGALLISAIPLNAIYSNKTERAIDTYNDGIPYNRHSSLQVEWTGSGLVIRF